MDEAAARLRHGPFNIVGGQRSTGWATLGGPGAARRCGRHAFEQLVRRLCSGDDDGARRRLARFLRRHEQSCQENDSGEGHGDLQRRLGLGQPVGQPLTTACAAEGRT
ncbi:MAG: hypothetical protein M3R70_01310, partial [Actinomycetota bacterium]|nr:hypothetical protein [Actinomycetota bacterium]